jgi:hypothetical protein
MWLPASACCKACGTTIMRYLPFPSCSNAMVHPKLSVFLSLAACVKLDAGFTNNVLYVDNQKNGVPLQAVWPNLISHGWPVEVQALVLAVVLKLQDRYILLMSHAYSHINVAKAAVLLGLPEPEAISCMACPPVVFLHFLWSSLAIEGNSSLRVACLHMVIAPLRSAFTLQVVNSYHMLVSV